MEYLTRRLAAIRQLAAAATFYDTSLWYQFVRMRRLHDKSNFSVADALFWGLTDPLITDDKIDCFMSREARTRLQNRVNDRSGGPDVDDKARFYRICESAGLAIPKTFGLLTTTQTKAAREPDAVHARIAPADLPDGQFVAKPVWGMKGVGLVFFEKNNSTYTIKGTAGSLYTLMEVLEAHATTDYLVVQSRVAPHAHLAEISKSEAVQSVRIVTYLDDEARPHILFARFKYVRQGNDVDNFSDGETGNLIADVDIESGQINKAVKKVVGEFGLRPVTHHPDTGVSLSTTLPCWQETIQLVCKAALVFGRLRALAWDVALTPDGPVILEANQDWEIFPIAPYRKPDAIGTWDSLIA